MLTAAVLVPLSKLQVLFLKSWFLSFNASLSGFCFGVGSPPQKSVFFTVLFCLHEASRHWYPKIPNAYQKSGIDGSTTVCPPPFCFVFLFIFFYFFLFLLNSSCYAIYAHSLSTDLHICTLYMNEGRCL